MPAESSIKQYSASVNGLAKRGFKDLSSTAEILEAIKTTAKGDQATKNTQKNTLNGLMHFTRGTPAFDVYSKKMIELRDEIQGAATYTATEKSVPWDVLSQIYKKYDGQDRRILAVYTLAPPRRLHEYATMRVVARKPRKIEGNYLVFNKSGLTFYFGEYKTRETYGVQSFKVPVALREELDEHIVAGQPLFSLASGKPFGDTEFSKHIGDLTAPHTPRNVRATPTTFRHSYITHFLAGNPTTAQRIKVAEMCGHSTALQLQYDQRDE